jgi:hypothetical protein
MRRDPHRLVGAGALSVLLASALLAGCGGGGQEPALRSPEQAAPGPAPASAPAAAASPAVFKAEKAWKDPEGNPFTILVTVHRPSNAGLEMCSMATSFIGPSVVVSVRNDSRAKALKGPILSVTDRAVAFPHGKYGCSYAFAPSNLETFKPGESHTYRAMAMAPESRFDDIRFEVSVPAKQQGKTVTKELLRVPAAKLYEAYQQGPLPTTPPAAPGATQTSHHG